ncbi:AraC family transcriptional regulator [Dyadobacter sp. CY327]|uniref:helix-turn-helix domain-containing protein n=1 Tax=Dyadobacter sp. CY327 TaxID=2907301 RepID=UPI001F2ADD68|nr:helix-turn-helix domain-containing protein [Dyadobacter sp. CY327]MCE7072603.1 AraC family transcriptional regulator [Dyadobacter sp. CY327]
MAILQIRNMVSRRCQLVVQAEFQVLGIRHGHISLGEVEVDKELPTDQRDRLNSALKRWGLELMDDKKAQLIENIKIAIIEMVARSSEKPKLKNSKYLCERLGQTYPRLANTFSEVTGDTIENFIITSRIEQVKELIISDELSLTEISYLLKYSSVAHLSTQFKRVTGLTPTFFKGQNRSKAH